MCFPQGILWGTSISAAQCEGGWDEGGKSPAQVDYANATNASTSGRRLIYKTKECEKGELKGAYAMFLHLPDGGEYCSYDDVYYPKRKASDFYHHYKEDIVLMAEMGFSTFNTTISWARIFPYGVKGGVNQEGVELMRYKTWGGIDLISASIGQIEKIWYDLCGC